MMKKAILGRTTAVGLGIALLSAASCGAVYQSSSVGISDEKVRVIELNAETLLQANRSTYVPRALPEVFFANAGVGSPRGVGALPEPVSAPDIDLSAETERLPPAAAPGPYRMGPGDVIAVGLPGGDAAQLREGTYAVQDDGAIALPGIGRVTVAGLTLAEAEAAIFQRLVDRQQTPTFTMEVASFGSQRVSIGGAVRAPGTQVIGIAPLYLDEAISGSGGVASNDEGSIIVRLYRGGELFTIPLKSVYAPSGNQRIRLVAGDSVFVDMGSDLAQAQDYFAEQIKLVELRQGARQAALQELNTEISVRRGALEEERDNFSSRVDLDAVDRDYVYLTGEVAQQGRFAMPFETRPTLADALYTDGEGIAKETGNVAEIYVLRASEDPRAFGAVTAWHLDARDATNLTLATRFELRPNDVIFVAEQPVTRWGRVIKQITPSLITQTVSATR